MPSSATYDPTAHLGHALAPLSGENVPTAHRMHAEACSAPEYSPAAHCRHVSAPTRLEYRPGWHGTHSSRPPGLQTDLKPALHVHPALVAPADESELSGQSRQLVEPSELYVPGKQSLQVRSVPARNFPALQAPHPAKDVWPIPVEYVPPGHLSHTLAPSSENDPVEQF